MKLRNVFLLMAGILLLAVGLSSCEPQPIEVEIPNEVPKVMTAVLGGGSIVGGMENNTPMVIAQDNGYQMVGTLNGSSVTLEITRHPGTWAYNEPGIVIFSTNLRNQCYKFKHSAIYFTKVKILKNGFQTDSGSGRVVARKGLLAWLSIIILMAIWNLERFTRSF